MDWVLGKVVGSSGCGASVGEERFTDFDFADDAVIFPESMEALIVALERLNEESECLGFLRSCYLTSGCCESLSSALSVDHSRVIQLELSDNNLEDSGVRLLCEGLRSPNCKLQKLRLQSCGLTSECCEALSLALSTEHSHHLTELWLSSNNLEDSGVHWLCLHEIQKAIIFEFTRNLEEQSAPGDPRTRAVIFETRYTELMVIHQYKRTPIETQHELLKTGLTHAKLVEKQVKEKCERIWTEQLFRRSPGSVTSPNIVVVSGVAGIGKTTMVQKIMFDWARGTHYRKFAFIFLFKFRELNFLDNTAEPQMTLTKLIVRQFKHLNNPRLIEILKKPKNLLFIFDGLDEYKYKLDFTHRSLCSSTDGFFPVHILVSSLVCQTLLKGCSILITSRPTALKVLDMERVDRFLEVLGFFPEQRQTYFKNFFGNTELGDKAFQYVMENDILYTMCYNPSYCWIMCSVLKKYFTQPEDERGETPKTVTELFVMFLHNILTNHRREAEDERGILVKLGKMEYYGVDNRTLVFYDKYEIFSFGLRSVLSSPFLSGFLKDILQKENSVKFTAYTFFHLTLQEFITACSFYLDPSSDIEGVLAKLSSCEDGRFEIFTQFLIGLARPTVFKTLGPILGEFERKTAVWILEWVKKRAERFLGSHNINEALRVCQWLFETHNNKLIRDVIRKDLKLNFSDTNLSPLDCSVMGSVIKCCEELQELNLSDTMLSPECIKRLAPAFSCCKHVM
ncbi:NLRP3 protein, partial [Polypterus senegalus]